MRLTRKQLRRLIEASVPSPDAYLAVARLIQEALDKLETLQPGEVEPVDVRELRLLAMDLLNSLTRVGDEAVRWKQSDDTWRQRG